MTALVARRRCGHFPRLVISFLAVLLVANGPASADAAGDGDRINVVLDQARLIKLPERVYTVVIGNPIRRTAASFRLWPSTAST